MPHAATPQLPTADDRVVSTDLPMARVTAEPLRGAAANSPQPLPELITGSTRRILWIVGLFRAVCGALLLGLALLLDLRAMNVDAPNSFLTAASLYFVFGLAAFGWIQQERVRLPLVQTLFALVSGDIFFIALILLVVSAVVGLLRGRPGA